MISHADLAAIAKASYSGPQSLQVAGDVRADLVPRGGELVVVCPGTHPDDPLDWIRDLRAWPKWFAGIGYCHSGFGAGGVDLWRKIRAELPARQRIAYCGHSLGGALAQVLAALHAAAGLSSCRLVTFGAPRVPFMLNPVFGRLVRSAWQAVEYQRAGDPVPDVPSAGLFFHPTRRRAIGEASPDPIANHSIDRYAADLAALGL